MHCNEIQSKLTAFLHGELNEQETIEIHRHLSECESCLKLEYELRKTDKALNTFKFQSLPENFDEGLAKKLENIGGKRRKFPDNYKLLVYAIAATILITLGAEYIFFSYIISRPPELRLADYPTKHAVFNAEAKQKSDKTSLKDRFIDKYANSAKQKFSIEKLKNTNYRNN